MVEGIKVALEAGKRADTVPMEDEDRDLVKDLCLMTIKPIIYVINIDEAELSSGEELADEYAKKLEIDKESVVIVSARIEAELSEMSELEQKEYLETLGLVESGLERLIKVGYHILGLQSFLTAGEKEVRAWTIRKGMTAVEASGVIHTDFMKKFINAEIVSYENFVRLGGWKQAREAGKARQEGRDYVMREGDVVEFKIGA
jgi:ribosome-binding ATPase YchF (GTP1/OBG family)